MISTDSFSADSSAFKLKPIHPDWRIFFAGNDMGRIEPTIRRIAQYLHDKVGPNPCAYIEVEDSIRAAWNHEMQSRIESLYLGRYGLTMEDFLREGERTFGSQYQSMKYQVDEVRLGFELLVVGYDVLGFPTIMSVTDPGAISHHTTYRFWAIGSGAPAALTHFFSYGLSVFQKDCESVLYKCLAAKFASEVAPGVGEKTFVLIHRRDGTMITTPGGSAIRDIWEKYGVPSMPDECINAAAALLNSCRSSPVRDQEKAAPTPSDSQTSTGQP